MDDNLVLRQAADGLDMLERVFAYLNRDRSANDLRYAALREIVRAETTLRATVAQNIVAKAFLPPVCWNLTAEDFDPFLRSFLCQPVS